MHTLHEPFDDGLYAEAGALYLTSNNPGLDYARSFGLELVPVPSRPDLGSIVHIDGHRLPHRRGEAMDWPLELREDERGSSIDELQTRYHRATIGRIEGVERFLEGGLPQSELEELDRISLAGFWRANGASEAAIRIMRLRYYDGYGEGIETVSALQLARESASFRGATGIFRVRGGNDRICAALAGRLEERVHYASPVVAIHQDATQARLTLAQGPAHTEVTGDIVVLTPPLQVLRDMHFAPALTPARDRAIREVAGTDVTRVFLQTRTRFWETAGYDGSAVTDLPIGSVFHATAGQEGRRGILESFTYGAAARSMAARERTSRLDVVREHMARVYPDIRTQAEKGSSYAWGDDPWARGGHSAFGPGQLSAFYRVLRAPEGRVHFAGDAIGGVPGYSHAAFASGREVAERIARL